MHAKDIVKVSNHFVDNNIVNIITKLQNATFHFHSNFRNIPGIMLHINKFSFLLNNNTQNKCWW